MLAKAKSALRGEGFDEQMTAFEWSIGFRYARQVHEVATPVRATTPLDDAGLQSVVDDFEAIYERKYGKGSAYRGAGIEMTQFRLTARGIMERPEIEAGDIEGPDAGAALVGKRDVFVDAEDGFAPADIYDFDKLQPGNTITGPCVVHTPITTIVVQAAQTAQMDTYRNLIIDFD
jgi:N-methylhydantoinase A